MKCRIAFSVMLIVSLGLLSLSAVAQDSYRVGETVELKCTCFGPYEWVKARVEAIDGDKIKVRYGNGRYQTQVVSKNSTDLRSPGSAAREARDNQLRDAFVREAKDKYMRAVGYFASTYDSRYIRGGSPNTPAEWQKTMSDLAELDGLCKGKFAGVTDDLVHYLREGQFENRYAVWCKIADQRLALEGKARAAAAKHMISLPGESELRAAFEQRENRLLDDTQLLIYETAKWKQQQIVKLKPQFANYGVDVPPDFFDAIEKKGAEMKALIDQTAPTRSFDQPSYKDGAVESLIKAKFIAEHPGAQILRSGVSYPTWAKRESLSYIGSDSNYRFYKVEYNFYKRGWVLMRLPNRPHCQAREWIAGRGAKGLAVVTLGRGGIFMKCQ